MKVVIEVFDVLSEIGRKNFWKHLERVSTLIKITLLRRLVFVPTYKVET